MGSNTGDRILETTVSPGTGNVSLAGAVTGYRTFASVITANGDQFPYVIAGGSDWETGIGTRLTSTTFSRAVIASSNANALVNFSGTCEVWIDWINSFIHNIRADNLIINGGMVVSQEKVTTQQTSITATTVAVADQFHFSATGTGVFTVEQFLDAPTAISGLTKSVKVTVTTADSSIASGDIYDVYTAIEGYRIAQLSLGLAGASPFSIGFWVKAHRTGIYGFQVQNSAGNRVWVTEYTINAADTWEYKTVVISSETSGSWNSINAAAMYITWTLSAGAGWQTGSTNSWLTSSFTTTANQVNGVGLTSDVFQLTGVSLIPGVVPVPQGMSGIFTRPFQEELTLCKRYYEKSFPYTTVPAQNAGIFTGDFVMGAYQTGASVLRAAIHSFSVRKRAAPTIVCYNPAANNAQLRNFDTSTDGTSTSGGGTETGITFDGICPSGTGLGHRIAIHWTADARMF
jgi:hypothetical protein